MSASTPPAITVVDAGALSLIEDLGRAGHADLGLSPSGALDRTSLKLANSLLSNCDAAAGLEVLGGGLRLRFDRSVRFAVTGACGPVTLDGKKVGLNMATTAPPESELRFGQAELGLRYYVGFAGGLAAEQLLGSSSADLLSGFGPPPLRNGDRLALAAQDEAVAAGAATPAVAAPVLDVVPRAVRNPPGSGPISARISVGPRRDWFDSAAWAMLVRGRWTVSPDSNRVGLRLDGPLLPRSLPTELPSEGLMKGALQVPPSGMPTLFLADHPVTGGYPVIAVVRPADLDLLAQARPGQPLRFLAV